MAAPPSDAAEAADAAAVGSSQSATGPVGWLEAEPALGGAFRVTLAMLARRARGSWRVWVPAAVVIACLLTVRRARQPDVYSVTVVLRAVEGVASGTRATDITLGQLHADVDARAFTTERLIEVMRRHVVAFPDVVDDPSDAVTAFRDIMGVDFEENDFIEDREPGDPPRSALIAVSFHAAEPELAWSVAHELGDLLVESSQEGQRRVQKRRQEAATLAVKQAAADYDAAVRAAAGVSTLGVRLARERLLTAQAAEAAAGLSANAVAEHQVLRFDIVDAGLMPTRVDKRADLLSSFVVLLVLCLATIWLVAGAFDPRVLDVVDLAALGAPVLGQVPALPAFRDSAVSSGGRGGPRPPRV